LVFIKISTQNNEEPRKINVFVNFRNEKTKSMRQKQKVESKKNSTLLLEETLPLGKRNIFFGKKDAKNDRTPEHV
jgi:hypothetical protein